MHFNHIQIGYQPRYSKRAAWAWWAFFGNLGAHQFYLGNRRQGWLRALTFGGLFMLTIKDAFTLSHDVESANLRALAEEATR